MTLETFNKLVDDALRQRLGEEKYLDLGWQEMGWAENTARWSIIEILLENTSDTKILDCIKHYKNKPVANDKQ